MISPFDKLPILVLPHPNVLLPGAHITISIPQDVAQAVSALMQDVEDDAPLVIGCMPAPSPESTKCGEHGCSAKVIRVVRSPPRANATSPQCRLQLSGIRRITWKQAHSTTLHPLSSHPIIYPSSLPAASPQTSSLFRSAAIKLLDRLTTESSEDQDKLTQILNGRIALYKKVSRAIRDVEDEQLPSLADVLVVILNTGHEEKLKMISISAAEDRLKEATLLATQTLSRIEVTTSVSKSLQEDLSKQQKIFILTQQQAAISRELGRLRPELGDDVDDSASSTEEGELAEIRRKIALLLPDSEERRVATREYRRLKRMPPSSVETGVIRTYLDQLVSLPWPTSNTESADVLTKDDIEKARAALDADHYGLEAVKRRLIEHLAVMRLKQLAAKEEHDLQSNTLDEQTSLLLAEGAKDQKPKTSKRVIHKGPILLLYGPPGVGKTSIAQSLARALGRPFQRISLGGVRDEAEIRGHRRTYVASGPGNIVQAIRKAERLDPVILLDEIDKVSNSNFHGDPAAALLEVLDPEQNWSFKDHYINVPLDLSQALFIATANTLDTISAPLLDRCEVIRLSGYTHPEKLAIAERYLVPKQLKANGMSVERCDIEKRCLKRIIYGWTREAGVRGLERHIGGVVRAKAVEWSEGRQPYSPVVLEDELEAILGPERYDGEDRERVRRPGVVYGLVVMGAGEGGILPVETAILPGEGNLKLSGSLGDVIKESAELALSWVKSHAYSLGLTPSRSTNMLKDPDAIDIHLHLPAGAQKKDGPSAGIAMVCAFVSLLSGLTIPTTTAMTGEITLRGAVTPVGGIKEKVLGAHRAGIRKVILPRRNRRDVFGKGDTVLPEDVKRDMEFVFVDRVEEVIAAAFVDGEGERRELVSQWIREGAVCVEARL